MENAQAHYGQAPNQKVGMGGVSIYLLGANQDCFLSRNTECRVLVSATALDWLLTRNQNSAILFLVGRSGEVIWLRMNSSTRKLAHTGIIQDAGRRQKVNKISTAGIPGDPSTPSATDLPASSTQQLDVSRREKVND